MPYKIIDGKPQGSAISRDVHWAEIRPVLSTSIYAENDVFFEELEILNQDGQSAAGYEGGGIQIQSIAILDKEQINADFDLLFNRSNFSVGTINLPATLDGTNFDEVCCAIPIYSWEYEMHNVISEARKDFDNVHKIAWAESGSKKVYLWAISKNTRTFSTNNALEIKIAFTRV